MFRCAVSLAYAYTEGSGPPNAGTGNGFAPGRSAASFADWMPPAGRRGRVSPRRSGTANIPCAQIVKYANLPSGDQLRNGTSPRKPPVLDTIVDVPSATAYSITALAGAAGRPL